MQFASTPALRAEVLLACKVLSRFRIAEGFGHVTARVPEAGRVLMTPRKALGLVRSEDDLLELDMEGNKVAGGGEPALEVPMHLAVYRRRADVMAAARGHPRHVAAFASAGAPLKIAHGFGTNLGSEVTVFEQPFLIADAKMGDAVADTLGGGQAVILQANGMIAVGQSVPHACVLALFLEETAELQLLAQAGGLTPRPYSPEGAARRHGDDPVHEPIRAWDYYVGVAEGKIDLGGT